MFSRISKLQLVNPYSAGDKEMTDIICKEQVIFTKKNFLTIPNFFLQDYPRVQRILSLSEQEIDNMTFVDFYKIIYYPVQTGCHNLKMIGKEPMIGNSSKYFIVILKAESGICHSILAMMGKSTFA